MAITLTTRDLEPAMRRAEAVNAAWVAAGKNSDWQTYAVELFAIPKVWRAVWRARGRQPYYQPIRRVSGYGLPGYVLGGWNGEPRDDWHYAHSPSVVYDGLRREVADPYWLYIAAMHATGRLDPSVRLRDGHLAECLRVLGITIKAN